MFLGQEEIVGEILGFVKTGTSAVLIGAGGIGKTSSSLTVLRRELVKLKSGDESLSSLVHFLNRLSIVIGVGTTNPNSLAPLRPFLSSKQTFPIIDNVECILDPNAGHTKALYAVVD